MFIRNTEVFKFKTLYKTLEICYFGNHKEVLIKDHQRFTLA